MKKEEMIKELDETLGKANVKLVNICGDKKNLEDVVLTVEHGPDAEIVRSGMNIVETIPNADVFGALKKTKRAIWSIVDKTRYEARKIRYAELGFSQMSISCIDQLPFIG